jgi:hypothetical protein
MAVRAYSLVALPLARYSPIATSFRTAPEALSGCVPEAHGLSSGEAHVRNLRAGDHEIR